MVQTRSLKLGAHIPIASGLLSVLEKAKAWQAEVIQIFVNNPQAWKPQTIAKELLLEFGSKAKALNIDIYIHSIYLINLCSYNPYFVDASVASLNDSLEKGEIMGAKGVITHIGSHKGSTLEEALPKVARNIKKIFVEADSSIDLILETSAGAGNIVGDRIEEIAQIFERVNSDRLKFALDTAHLFASGYELRTLEGVRKLILELEKNLGIQNLSAWHFNDTNIPLGEHKDRHEVIGEGLLGRETFLRLLSEPRFSGLPAIIETPDIDFSKDKIPSLEILKALRKEVVNARAS